MKYEAIQPDFFSRLTGGAVSASEAARSLLEQARNEPERAVRLVASLLSVSLEPDDSVRVLQELVDHHARLSQRFGMEIDLRVAAMDYATRHPDLVVEPVVVDQRVLALSQRRAAVDELTGLFNRRFLDIYLGKEINRARRYRETFSLLFLDLDDFKSINDRHGHDTGDEVLATLSREIQRLLRGEDFAARYGGEEFLVVFPHTDAEGAKRFADRLNESVRSTTFPHDVAVTFSGGISTYPLHGSSARELLHSADTALYGAKSAGKNRVRAAVADKRSSSRHIADLRAQCSIDGREIGEVRLRDISLAGVSVQSGILLAPGQTIRFEVPILDPSDGTAAVEVFAQIVWSRKLDDGQYRLGGRWQTDDSEALRTLLDQASSE